MILLKATTEILELLTTSVADLDYSVSFVDITTTTFVPSTSEGKIITATTTVITAAPGASTQRQIKLVSIRNTHASISNNVTIRKDISTTKYSLTPTITLFAGELLQYVDGQGWTVYAVGGAVRALQTAGGSTTQVQVNVDGVATGDPNFTWNTTTKELGLSGTNTSMLLSAITTEPLSPTGQTLRIYSKNISGRIMPKWVGPSGLDTIFQPAFFGNNITMWNTTNATAGVWLGTVGIGAGTYTTQLPTFTNRYTSTKRGRYANVVTTANQVLGQRNTEAMYFRGSISGTGGFYFFARFGFDNWTAGGRLFVGMHTATTVVSANPSLSLNIAGFGIDAGDTAITFMHNDSTGVAVKDTIASQPALASNNGYDAYVFCAPNDSVVYYRLVDINTGVEIINASTNIDLPTSTIGLSAGVLASNAALTPVTSINIGLNRVYVETDY